MRIGWLMAILAGSICKTVVLGDNPSVLKVGRQQLGDLTPTTYSEDVGRYESNYSV